MPTLERKGVSLKTEAVAECINADVVHRAYVVRCTKYVDVDVDRSTKATITSFFTMSYTVIANQNYEICKDVMNPIKRSWRSSCLTYATLKNLKY